MMKLFKKILSYNGEKSNTTYILILVLVTICWTIVMWDILFDGQGGGGRLPLGFFMVAIIAGELTRRFLNFFSKNKNVHFNSKIPINKIEDQITLKLGILWSIIWLMFTLLFRFDIYDFYSLFKI